MSDIVRLTVVFLGLVVVIGCQSTKAFDEYDAVVSNKSAKRINLDDGGCFEVFVHPYGYGFDRTLVRQCASSEWGQAVTEGVMTGLTLGLIRPDHGARPAKFERAGSIVMGDGCRVSHSQRVGDGMGGVAAYEVFFDCSNAPSPTRKKSFAEGLGEYDQGNYGNARLIWEAIADEGNATAAYNLGEMYIAGTGLPSPDRIQALKWFKRAELLGYEGAASRISDLWGSNINESGQSLSASHSAPKTGFDLPTVDANATFQDAMIEYERGNYKVAISIWTNLARSGDKNAAFNLGEVYLRGKGLPEPDAKVALNYFKMAEALGHPGARNRVVELSK